MPHIGAQVREEQHKAEHQRRKLAAALEAKRGPLLQSKERFAMRKARPDREAVQVRTKGGNVASDAEKLPKPITHQSFLLSECSHTLCVP